MNTSGKYGVYFSKKTKGYKYIGDGYNSKEECEISEDYALAWREFYLLSYAYVSGIVPKAYTVRIMKRQGFYYPVLVMQHLGNKCMAQMKISDQKRIDVIETLRNKLLGYGIEHNDLHSRNVMKYRNKWYAIDFTPDYIGMNGL